MRVNRGTVDQAGSRGRRQGPQNPLVALGIERDRLAPPVGIFLNDPGREPP